MNNIRQFRKDLRTFILADATVDSLIGNRFFAIRGDQQGAKPYCVSQIVDARDDLAHDGPLKLPEYRVQISVYAPTSDASDAVAKAIYDRLCPDEGLNGLIGASTQIAWCINDNNLDSDSGDPNLVQHVMDFRIRLK